MSDPESDAPANESSIPSSEAPDAKKRRLESVIPELLKRAVELGVEKVTEAPENLRELVHNLKLPKEVAGIFLADTEETKNELFRIVAKEVCEFLDANLSSEMQKVLATLQVEINATIRFKPNDQAVSEGGDESAGPRLGKPEVKTELAVKRDRDEPTPESRGRRGRE